METLFRTRQIDEAVALLSSSEDEERGAIFTKPEVVDFILDLAGYTPDRDLTDMVLLEPSFGEGDFLFPVIDRLLESWALHGYKEARDFEKLLKCIRAVELHTTTFNCAKVKLASFLEVRGIGKVHAQKICSSWLINDDFLLTHLDGNFTHVVGNPPYVRQESIPEVLISEYRRMYHTIYDRADLYVPFIEKSLRLLAKDGALGFICSDRWIKNRYGAPLRDLISKNYTLKYYVDMAGLPVFKKAVSAYASVIIITKGETGITRVARKPEISKQALQNLSTELLGSVLPNTPIVDVRNKPNSDSPWLLHNLEESGLIDFFEKNFSTLADEGCKVGIGVATGLDSVFIGGGDHFPVEEDRKLPLITTTDIATGKIQWGGKVVVNPFQNNGDLVDLATHPLLAAYFLEHKKLLLKRNVAKKNPKSWYRTIDKITKDLTFTPKLLIPDIKLKPQVVYDSGKYYPHHNLYYVLSDKWDIQALQTILKSSITEFFVSSYSIRMRGEYLRFQAQYLRRIRIPRWTDLSTGLQKKLKQKSNSLDVKEIDELVFEAYGLNRLQQIAIGKSLSIAHK